MKNLIPTTSTIKAIGFTLLVIAALHRVDALEPVKDMIFD